MLSNTMATSMLNPKIFKRENIERMIRNVEEKEIMRVLIQLMENQKKCLNYKNNC